MANTYRKSYIFTDGMGIEVKADTKKIVRNTDDISDNSYYKKLTNHQVRREFVRPEDWTGKKREKLEKSVNPVKRRYMANRNLARRFKRIVENNLTNLYKGGF
ncbi:MAG: hypothetical protein PHT94_00655 [Candidatus Nanoarchaeia archaeon]|nr:hypothetical protein [Candidatus Nanoarchaeia archaeon]